MNKRPEGEKGPAPEKIADQKYHLLKEVDAKIDRLMNQVHELEMKTDENLPKEEYKRIIAERDRLAVLLNEAMEEEKRVMHDWFAAMDEEDKVYEKTMGGLNEE